MPVIDDTLFGAIQGWIDREPSLKAVALFGSSVLEREDEQSADEWSDIDLHIVTTAPDRLEHLDWAGLLPNHGFCMQTVRPATGGVRKVTVLFADGQVDMVVVPQQIMRLARLGYRLSLGRFSPRLDSALHEIKTCIRGGFRMLKGEDQWGAFYARIANSVDCVRLTDDEMRVWAGISLTDQLWVLQKIARGELSAAQHKLHSSLAEINFRLLRELRLRRNQPLPSFGLGRHVEKLLLPEELNWVQVDSRCEGGELHRAVSRAHAGLLALMHELVPSWEAPPEIIRLLNRFSALP